VCTSEEEAEHHRRRRHAMADDALDLIPKPKSPIFTSCFTSVFLSISTLSGMSVWKYEQRLWPVVLQLFLPVYLSLYCLGLSSSLIVRIQYAQQHHQEPVACRYR